MNDSTPSDKERAVPSSPFEIRPTKRSPFVVGGRYRVKRDFQALRDHFVAGEVLTYTRDAYSLYDGYTGYFFKQEGAECGRVWDIPDEEDVKIWSDLFEEI